MYYTPLGNYIYVACALLNSKTPPIIAYIVEFLQKNLRYCGKDLRDEPDRDEANGAHGT